MPVSFETGALLEVRGARWLLTGVAAHAACIVLTLEGRDPGNAGQHLRVIAPFDQPRRISSSKPRRRPRRAVLRAALAAIVDARPPTGLWTAAGASIELWPYQLEPALAAINGVTRLLLADAVGLGKTIQAGLVLSELRERRWVERALIVCPAGLRDTWARELLARFQIRAVVLDQAAIAERVASLPPGVNPWAGHAVAISSIDLVKRPEVLAAIASAPIDLLIADEAHHLAPGTDRGAAVAQLASRATWCVLLSATPHSGDEAAFEYLTRIGARGDQLAIFRRDRIEAGHTTVRRARVVAVVPTADEAALFAAIEHYTQAIWRQRGRLDPAARLIAVTLARRAASSGRAIARTLTRRLALLAPAPFEPVQPLLPWDDDDSADLGEADALLSTPGLDRIDEERGCLERLIQLAQRCVDPSKLRRLTRLLERVREPAVIFTEYRDSLEALVDALGAGRRVAAIHGAVPVDQRRAAVDAFNSGRIDVLVATDAAGEGLNLQHRCRLVIDLELPWNPLRLEQRIGRVDRIGQRRVVHAIRMFHPHTVEERVLEHLRLRHSRAADALQCHISEATMAGAVFDDKAIEAAVGQTIATCRITLSGTEALRLEAQRRARAAGFRHPGGLVWTAPPNGRHVDLLVLRRQRFMNPSGLLVGDALDARVLRLRPIPNRREWLHSLSSAASRLTAPNLDEPPMALGIEALRAAIRARLAAIRADRSRRVEEQSSLFDRRTEQAALARAAAERGLDQALTRVTQAIGAPAADNTRVELLAAWPWTFR